MILGPEVATVMHKHSDTGLFTYRSHVHEHPFEPYERVLRQTNQSKVDVPKSEVSELPPRFEEHYPANEMQENGADASYRDDRKEDSVHAIEYADHWTIHLDDFNPRFKEKQLDHLVNDAPMATALLIVFVLLAAYYN